MSFQFKQFSIEDHNSTMKVGTDGVILGAWVDAKEATNILDIGTGSGLIAMMLAQKCKANIKGIDIDKNSMDQANTNFRSSEWSQFLESKYISLQDLSKESEIKFDLIVSNPPFFVDSLKSPVENKRISKHNDHLSFEELAHGIKQLLTKNGRACIILPKTESSTFIDCMLLEGFHLNRLLDIYPKPKKEVNRCLMEFEFIKRERIHNELQIRNSDNQYTDEYKDFTKEYYLNF